MGNAPAFEFALDEPAPTVVKDALISPCGLYRYWLTRQWDVETWALPIIMLNPSTADASIDDPTIGRCMSFARRDGFGGIRVMNLFAFRATSPADMKAADDPIGPDCPRHLSELFIGAVRVGVPILAAWGAHGAFGRRASHVLAQSSDAGCNMVCLGTTREGHPRHPLYVPGGTPFQPFA